MGEALPRPYQARCRGRACPARSVEEQIKWSKTQQAGEAGRAMAFSGKERLRGGKSAVVRWCFLRRTRTAKSGWKAVGEDRSMRRIAWACTRRRLTMDYLELEATAGLSAA
jgi:hypothetical protein